MMYLAMIYILLVLGIVMGSFINALVWRFYINEKKHKFPEKKLSILNGRSICPKCRHLLHPVDLVPVLSWVVLGGKCRYCSKKISPLYPLIEILTGVVFVLSYKYWPFDFNYYGKILFTIWLLLVLITVSLALYDLKYKILPNRWVYSAIVVSLLFILIYYFSFNQGIAFIESRLLGVLFSSGFFYLIFQISKGKWIGGGDVKLCIALGLVLGGPLSAILMLFIASTLGTVVMLGLVMIKKFNIKTTIPFGPLLIISFYLCFLVGSQILNWYSSIYI
jgi:leader peptidase (prepilin peptidase)/N-methyltransferase